MIINELDRFNARDIGEYWVVSNILIPKLWFQAKEGTELAIYDAQNQWCNSTEVVINGLTLIVSGREHHEPLLCRLLSKYGRKLYLRIE